MPKLDNVEPVKKAGFADLTYTQARRKEKLQREEEELNNLMSGNTQNEDPENEEDSEDGTENAQVEVEKEAEKTVSEESEPLSAEEQTFKKRYGDLRRHNQKIEARLKDLESQHKETNPPKSEADVKQWIEKYPDFAAIVEAIASKKADEMYGDSFKSIEEERANLARAKAEAAIVEKHSDFFKITGSDEFHEWIDAQPKRVQDALFENEDDAESAIRVLDLYKLDKGMTKSAKKSAAKAAASAVDKGSKASVSTDDGKPTFKESQIMKNSDK